MRTIKILVAAAAILLGSANHAMALDLKTILKNASEKAGAGSTAGSAIGGLVGNLLSTDKIDLQALVGDWKYDAPAVKFRSDNLLQKAGGAAATSVIEGKLAPYYKTAGIDNMTLSIAADSTFTMKIRGINISGTIEAVTDKNSDANFVFHFKAVKKINIGNLNTYVTKSATNGMDITFDITKLVTLLQKVTSLTGSKSLGAASSLLSSYDGVCAGFRVTEVKK